MELPKTIRNLWSQHPDKIREAWTEQDEFGAMSGRRSWSIWIELKPGWRWGEVHCIHEVTVKEALEAWREVTPCDCESCQQKP